MGWRKWGKRKDRYSRREVVNSEDTARAGLGREVNHLRASIKSGPQAVVPQADVGLGLSERACGGAANSHAEALSLPVSIIYVR